MVSVPDDEVSLGFSELILAVDLLLDLQRGRTDVAVEDFVNVIEIIERENDRAGLLPKEYLILVSMKYGGLLFVLTQMRYNEVFEPILSFAIRLFFALVSEPSRLVCENLRHPNRCEAIDFIQATISSYETAFGETCMILYFKAGCEYWKRNFTSAYEFFDRLRRTAGSRTALCHDSIGCCSVRPMREIVQLATTHIKPPAALKAARASKKDYVVVACADELYFSRYQRRLSHSLAAFPGVGLHFHVATENPQTISNIVDPDHGCSFEPLPKTLDAVPYYQSMRLLRMRQFMDLYQKPLMFIDIDSYFIRDPRELVDKIDSVHIGLNLNQRAWVPWRQYRADCILVNQNRQSRNFAQTVERLFLHLYNPSYTNNVMIDQAILTHAVESLRLTCRGVNVVSISSFDWEGFSHEKAL